MQIQLTGERERKLKLLEKERCKFSSLEKDVQVQFTGERGAYTQVAGEREVQLWVTVGWYTKGCIGHYLPLFYFILLFVLVVFICYFLLRVEETTPLAVKLVAV